MDKLPTYFGLKMALWASCQHIFGRKMAFMGKLQHIFGRKMAFGQVALKSTDFDQREATKNQMRRN